MMEFLENLPIAVIGGGVGVLFVLVLFAWTFKLPQDYEEKRSHRNQLLKKKAEKEDITQMVMRELERANNEVEEEL